jgi:hypothetical protein
MTPVVGRNKIIVSQLIHWPLDECVEGENKNCDGQKEILKQVKAFEGRNNYGKQVRDPMNM